MIFLTVTHFPALDHYEQSKNRKRRAEWDKDRGFTSTFLYGGFSESAFHSKNTPHLPIELVRSLHASVGTLL